MSDTVIGPPGSSNAIMVPVKHVGVRQERTDNVAGTGMVWCGGETLLVPEPKAAILLKYPDVWAFDREYLEANSGTNYDGRVPLVIYVTTDDMAALSAGEAEVMVVHANDERSLACASTESIDVMTALGRVEFDKVRGHYDETGVNHG